MGNNVSHILVDEEDERLEDAEFLLFLLGMEEELAKDLVDSDSKPRWGSGDTVTGRARNARRKRMDWEARVASLSDFQFRKRYRMKKPSFNKLVAQLRPLIEPDAQKAKNSSGSPIKTEVRLSVTLRFLGGGSYLDGVDMHGLGDNTVYPVIWKTCEALTKVLKLEFPTEPAHLKKLADEFYALTNGAMPGVVGALDGIAIEITRPTKAEHPRPKRFFNRKGFYALVLQAVCDANLKFTFAGIDCYGSTHDSEAFQKSDLYERLSKGLLPYEFHILGDDAYSLADYLLTPYPAVAHGLDAASDAFNFYHSKARITIERAFGVLVARWGVLWRALRASLKNNILVVRTVVRLHNFCIDEGDNHIGAVKDPLEYVWGVDPLVVTQDQCAKREARVKQMKRKEVAKRLELRQALCDMGFARPAAVGRETIVKRRRVQ